MRTMNVNILISFAIVASLAVEAFAEKQVPLHFTVSPDSVCQTIDNFGASDAWSMRFLGKWSEEQQKQAADWLFSCEMDEQGKPKGIGLSLWRFNLGAGSVEQGDSSQINYGTRTECFLAPDGSYDWNKQQGQRNFLRLAKERGVDQFLAFLNSPPVYFTQNGLATNTGRGGTLNLKENCYDDYACFLADAVEGVKKHDGIAFDYLCVVNEPDGHWNWIGPKQEGTPATNREIARVVRETSKEFQRRGISTKLLVNESSDYRCMLGDYMSGWERGYSISSFFAPDSADTYIGNLPNVPRLMAGHSYWTNTPLDNLRGFRVQLRNSLDKFGLRFWQTETCIMSNDEEIGGGHGFDFSMKTALYVARIIHCDLVYANASAWQWWRSVGGDYKDGLLRAYPQPEADDGYVADSKLLWALGNFSRFIRPGAVRLAVMACDGNGRNVPEGETDLTGVMVSAYRNADGGYVVVAINYSSESRNFDFQVPDKSISGWKLYRTSDAEGEDLAPVDTFDGMLSPRSITTFVSF